MAKEKEIPKIDWGPGPWQNEPDLEKWIDPDTGLQCMIKRNMMSGNLCGYVGVTTKHLAHGLNSDGLNKAVSDSYSKANRSILIKAKGDFSKVKLKKHPSPRRVAAVQLQEIKVHGGLTWAGPFDVNDLWWFGFDCSHAFDAAPGIEAVMASLDVRPDLSLEESLSTRRMKSFLKQTQIRNVYRDFSYVKSEVTELAKQLAAIKRRRKNVK